MYYVLKNSVIKIENDWYNITKYLVQPVQYHHRATLDQMIIFETFVRYQKERAYVRISKNMT